MTGMPLDVTLIERDCTNSFPMVDKDSCGSISFMSSVSMSLSLPSISLTRFFSSPLNSRLAIMFAILSSAILYLSRTELMPEDCFSPLFFKNSDLPIFSSRDAAAKRSFEPNKLERMPTTLRREVIPDGDLSLEICFCAAFSNNAMATSSTSTESLNLLGNSKLATGVLVPNI